jgi:hypothetical protein
MAQQVLRAKVWSRRLACQTQGLRIPTLFYHSSYIIFHHDMLNYLPSVDVNPWEKLILLVSRHLKFIHTGT